MKLHSNPLHRLFGASAALALTTLVSGCGLEGLLLDFLDGDPELIVLEDAFLNVKVPDGVSGTPTLQVYDLQGTLLAETSAPEESEYRTYVIPVPQSTLNGALRVVLISGEKVYKDLYFCLLPENALEEHLSAPDESTTAATLVVESMGTYRGLSRTTPASNAYALASFASDELEVAYDSVLSAISSNDAEAVSFAEDVAGRLEAASETGTEPVFQLAPLSDQLLGPSGGGDATEFNAAAASLADSAHAALVAANIQPEMFDAEHPFLTVIFTVSRAGDTENGNCEAYDVCDTQGGKSFDCDPNGRMYFTGALHSESEVKAAQFENILGSMTPNQPGWEMYDDGTHGDEVAGDSIFTIVFKLPEGLRIFYKYTWGQAGEKWTGTEEWPGNNRILEIKDVNGDGYVWRHDKAKDEAYNKDKVNLYGNVPGGQAITWDSDLNGDGYPESQENPLAYDVTDPSAGVVTVNGKCYQSFVSFVQPTKVARATAGQCRKELFAE